MRGTRREPVPARQSPDGLARGCRTLDRLEIGARGDVLRVGNEVAAELAREGVVPGACLQVAGRVPGGGPVIVTLGRARLALGRSLCRTIEVAET